ncbi:MAG: hypothetical protein ACMG6S_31875, partial [Byssovorax sp.]
ANGTALVNATAGTAKLGARTALIYGPDLSVPPLFWEGNSATAEPQAATTASVLHSAHRAPREAFFLVSMVRRAGVLIRHI